MTTQEALEVMRLKPDDLKRLSDDGIREVICSINKQVSTANAVEKALCEKQLKALNVLLSSR